MRFHNFNYREIIVKALYFYKVYNHLIRYQPFRLNQIISLTISYNPVPYLELAV
jgi:hypothetical protein